MAIFKEILRNDGSGITYLYRIDNGSITTLDYNALMNKPKINGKELIGDILIDIRNFDFTNVTNSGAMFTNVPTNCLIIVKDTTAKSWITSKFTTLTNVKTVDEL